MAFLENPLLYFFLHKSWIWQTLGHVMNIFLIGIFIMLQKNTFAQKKFKFHAPVQKCHFGNFSIFSKWHFFTRAWNLLGFLPSRYLDRQCDLLACIWCSSRCLMRVPPTLWTMHFGLPVVPDEYMINSGWSNETWKKA